MKKDTSGIISRTILATTFLRPTILKVFPKALLTILIFISLGNIVSAQEINSHIPVLLKAKVVEIISERSETIESVDLKFQAQKIRAQILRNEKKGEVITLDNDYSPMKVGDRFFLQASFDPESSTTYYAVSDFERRGAIGLFVGLFVFFVIAFGRWQGVRSLVSLGISIAVIFWVLIPLLLKGWPPVGVATLSATAILFFAIFFTHGFNRKSTIAFAGTVSAVIVTGLLAMLAVWMAHITGLAAEESIYLNWNTGGKLDFAGLYLAGIIIGMLGVLDDISITQVAVVRELYAVASHLTKKEIFTSAIRVGKEHVGALVNTLVLAYVGVALPAVMYFATATTPIGQLLNMEIFASEIIRTVIGSIGLIMTVPITTWLAVVFMKKFKGQKMTLDEMEHGHSHGGHSH